MAENLYSPRSWAMHRTGMCITCAWMEAEMKKRELFPVLVVSRQQALIPLLPTEHSTCVHCGPPRDRNLQLSPKLQTSCVLYLCVHRALLFLHTSALTRSINPAVFGLPRAQTVIAKPSKVKLASDCVEAVKLFSKHGQRQNLRTCL